MTMEISKQFSIMKQYHKYVIYVHEKEVQKMTIWESLFVHALNM